MATSALLAQADAYLKEGRLQEAEQYYRAVLQQDTKSATAWYKLSIIAQRVGKLNEAVQLLAEAMKLMPDSYIFQGNMGALLMQMGQEERALALLEKAIQRAPDKTPFYCNYAIALDMLGRVEDAIKALKKALKCDPACGVAYYTLGMLEKAMGHMEESRQAFRKALEFNINSPAVYRMITQTKKYSDADGEEIKELKQVLASLQYDPLAAAELHFALGKCYDDLKDYDQAFSHFKQGNALICRAYPYNKAALSHLVEKSKIVFDEDFFQQRATWGNQSKIPLFIVGMPRSGTTLIEQILSGHPQVIGKGEHPFFSRALYFLSNMLPKDKPYPENILHLHRQRVEAVGLEYLAKLAADKTGSSYVINKMPNNFEVLGFIHLCFPNAKIIHCLRDPMDTALSIYMQRFRETNHYAYDFQMIAAYYQAHNDLMDHWKRLFPELIYSVQYEDLIKDPDTVCQGLFDFCNLEWEETYLAFHENKRAIATASSWQVRQPLYGYSVGRWKHYEPHLSHVKAMFGYQD